MRLRGSKLSSLTLFFTLYSCLSSVQESLFCDRTIDYLDEEDEWLMRFWLPQVFYEEVEGERKPILCFFQFQGVLTAIMGGQNQTITFHQRGPDYIDFCAGMSWGYRVRERAYRDKTDEEFNEFIRYLKHFFMDQSALQSSSSKELLSTQLLLTELYHETEGDPVSERVFIAFIDKKIKEKAEQERNMRHTEDGWFCSFRSSCLLL